MKRQMTATRAFRYGTRALKAGDEFTASRADARVLEAIGRAAPAQAAKPPSLDDLRAQATALGVDVDNRWRESRLMAEIAAAQNGGQDGA